MDRRTGIIGIIFLLAAAGTGIGMAIGGLSPSLILTLTATFGVVGLGILFMAFRLGRVVWTLDPKKMATWAPGWATIRDVRYTGVGSGGGEYAPPTHLVMRLLLSVQPEGGAPYDVEHSQRFAAMMSGLLLPGLTVPVRVNLANPKRLAIVPPEMGPMSAPPGMTASEMASVGQGAMVAGGVALGAAGPYAGFIQASAAGAFGQGGGRYGRLSGAGVIPGWAVGAFVLVIISVVLGGVFLTLRNAFDSAESAIGGGTASTAPAALLLVDSPRPFVDALSAAIGDAALVDVTMYSNRAFATVANPAAAGGAEEYKYGSGVLGPPGAPSIAPTDPVAESFALADVNWDAIPGLVASAPGVLGLDEGEVTHVIVARNIPFDTAVLIRIYVQSGTESGFFEAAADGTPITRS